MDYGGREGGEGRVRQIDKWWPTRLRSIRRRPKLSSRVTRISLDFFVSRTKHTTPRENGVNDRRAGTNYWIERNFTRHSRCQHCATRNSTKCTKYTKSFRTIDNPRLYLRYVNRALPSAFDPETVIDELGVADRSDKLVSPIDGGDGTKLNVIKETIVTANEIIIFNLRFYFASASKPEYAFRSIAVGLICPRNIGEVN